MSITFLSLVIHASEFSYEPCCICFYEFTDTDPALILGCSHNFHGNCILDWVKRDVACPTCRQPITENLPSRFILRLKKVKAVLKNKLKRLKKYCCCTVPDEQPLLSPESTGIQ